jgi:hypothetical protein
VLLGIGIGPTVRSRGSSLSALAIAQSKGVPFFLYDFARTDLTFQDAAGQTLADDPTEAVALALSIDTNGSKTLAEVLAAQPEKVKAGLVAADFVAISNITVTDESPGVLRFTNVAGGVSSAAIPIPTGLTVGRLYQVQFGVFSPSANNIVNVGRINVNGLSFIAASGEDAWQTKTMLVVYASGNITAQASSLSQHGAAGDYFLARNISVKEIPGNHAIQTGAGTLRPTRQAGNVLRFDAADDNLLTALSGAVAGNAFIAKVTVPASLAATQVVAGFNAASNGRFQVANVKIYWNGVEEHSVARNGAPGAAVPYRLGANNNNGTAGNFFGGDIRFAEALKGAFFTAAEIASISSQWNATP